MTTARSPKPEPARGPGPTTVTPATLVWRRLDGRTADQRDPIAAPDGMETSLWLRRVAVYRWMRAHASFTDR